MDGNDVSSSYSLAFSSAASFIGLEQVLGNNEDSRVLQISRQKLHVQQVRKLGVLF